MFFSKCKPTLFGPQWRYTDFHLFQTQFHWVSKQKLLIHVRTHDVCYRFGSLKNTKTNKKSFHLNATFSNDRKCCFQSEHFIIIMKKAEKVRAYTMCIYVSFVKTCSCIRPGPFRLQNEKWTQFAERN